MKPIKSLALVCALALFVVVGCDKKDAKPADDKATKTETPEVKKEEPKKEEPKKEEPKKEEADDGTKWVASKQYGVKFKVPTDWKTLESKDAISVTAPDDTITIILAGTESTGVFETAMTSVSSAVKIKEMKTDKSQIVVINGLGGFQGSGSAVLVTDKGDQEIQFLGYALKTNGEKGVAMMVFAEAEMYEAKKEEIEAIAKTLQKG